MDPSSQDLAARLAQLEATMQDLGDRLSRLEARLGQVEARLEPAAGDGMPGNFGQMTHRILNLEHRFSFAIRQLDDHLGIQLQP